MNDKIPNKTASQVRYEEYTASLARERFYRFPQEEAEAIARHYVAHATIAMQLAELIKLRDLAVRGLSIELISKEYENLELVIQDLVHTIKQNHLHDFGIKLEWFLNSNET